MSKNNVPYLCGGTFYMLLLQSLKDRRIRINDLDGVGAKEKAINEVTCLKGLVKVFYNFNVNYSESTFTAHKNDYKLCAKNSTDWLRFETQYLVDEFDNMVKEHYGSALMKMNEFVDSFIDEGDRGKRLVRALLEVIYLDGSIRSDDVFFSQSNGVSITKQNLLDLDRIEARPFLLGVWHFIITNRQEHNIDGVQTIDAWTEQLGKQKPYKFVGTVGSKYALDKNITYECQEAVQEESENYNDYHGDEQQQSNEYDGKTVNQILNTPAIINQTAEKIVNIGHVEHLEI